MDDDDKKSLTIRLFRRLPCSFSFRQREFCRFNTKLLTL